MIARLNTGHFFRWEMYRIRCMIIEFLGCILQIYAFCWLFMQMQVEADIINLLSVSNR